MKYHLPTTPLTLMLHQELEKLSDQCTSGVMSRNATGFLFEESAPRRTCRRNPKLFDGRHISLTHMRNGRYQVHMRTISASSSEDLLRVAQSVYNELLNAFQIIQ